MALENFADILMSLRRQKAAASGRSPTQQEVAGLTEGYASSAESRLADEKSLALTERMHEETLAEQSSEFEQSLTKSASEFEKTYGLQKSEFEQSLTKSASEFEKTYGLEKAEAEESASQFAQQLAESKYQYQTTFDQSKYQFEENLAASMKQHDDEMSLAWDQYKSSVSQFNAELAQNQSQFESTFAENKLQFGETMEYNYWYAKEQIRIAEEADSGLSWLCTETDKQIGLPTYMLHAINRFRDYVWKNHKRIFVPYLRKGDQLVESINKKEGDKAKEVFKDFEESVLYPVMVAIDSCHMEDAFQLYRNKVLELVKEYLPEELETLKGLIVKDDERFLNSAV